MNRAIPQSDLSSDPRNVRDRLRAQQSLEYPGPSIPGLGWNMSTAATAAIAAVLAIAIGLWLGGRGKKQPKLLVPAVSRAELAAELAPVGLRLMRNPAIRAYVLRMLIRSLTRKVTG
jgi:hypothetical protein